MPENHRLYAKLMTSAQLGYALLDPSPATVRRSGKEVPMDEPEVSIGDVGYINSAGTWRQWFNIHRHSNDQVGRYLPNEFEYLRGPEETLGPTRHEPMQWTPSLNSRSSAELTINA
jgi:hypothetical protein